MIDCHAHLAAEEFEADRDAVVARARSSGVMRILVVGEDLEDNRRVLNVCARYDDMLCPCVGLHPEKFAEDQPNLAAASIEEMVTLARENRHRITAIGEVGLDYWVAKSHERRSAQRTCLERMAELAAELDLPLNVHSRSAGHYTLDLLVGMGATRVLMHAFDGKASHAARAAEQHGYLFSVPPSVVRSKQKEKLVRRLPLEALALESDSPVLGPVREARNEPANLIITVNAIAKIKGTSEENVREYTKANAQRLFGSLNL